MQCRFHRWWAFAIVVIVWGFVAEEKILAADPLNADQLFQAATAAGFQVRDVKADIPSAVHSALPFTTLDYENNLLRTLRERFQLEKVVGPARDEWTAQLMLKEWVHKAIPGGNPKVTANHALDILEFAAQGETFYCTHYAITYVECALALGWQARKIGVDRKHGPQGLGSTHHGVAEVWSNQFRKWVVIDPQSNLHFEKEGVPLSAWEIRAEWLKDHGAALAHMVGVPPHAVRKNPAIVWWDRNGEDESATYFWFYLEDRAVHSSSGEPGQLIFPQDEANTALIWYQNDDSTQRSRIHTGYLKNLFLPTSRIEDVYWTVGVVEATLAGVSKGSLQLSLDSYCPNGTGYEVSFDGISWERVKDEKSLVWTLRPGWNSLRLRTLGPRGMTGPEVSLLLLLE